MNKAQSSRLTISADDHTMRRLIDVLRDAGTRPVTFGELIDQGIAEPALRLRMLEMAGYRIERMQVADGDRRATGFRLVGEPPSTPGGSPPVRRPDLPARGWRRRVQHG